MADETVPYTLPTVVAPGAAEIAGAGGVFFFFFFFFFFWHTRFMAGLDRASLVALRTLDLMQTHFQFAMFTRRLGGEMSG